MTTIKLKLGQRDIEMTLEEAEAVRAELNRLLAPKPDKSDIEDKLDALRNEFARRPMYQPMPIVVEKPVPSWPQRRPWDYDITCNGMTRLLEVNS